MVLMWFGHFVRLSQSTQFAKQGEIVADSTGFTMERSQTETRWYTKPEEKKERLEYFFTPTNNFAEAGEKFIPKSIRLIEAH